MITAKIEWTEENIWDYIKYITFQKGKRNKILIISYAICILLVLTMGITSAIVTGQGLIFAVTGVAVLVLAGYGGFFVYTLKKYAKTIMEVNKDVTFDRIEFEDGGIYVFSGDKENGIIDWEKIQSADYSDKTAYLMTVGNSLLIIEENKIEIGTIEQLKALVDSKLVKKDDKLSEKA